MDYLSSWCNVPSLKRHDAEVESSTRRCESVCLFTSLTKEAEETELAKQMVLVSRRSYDIIRRGNSSTERGVAFVRRRLDARRGAVAASNLP